MRVLITGFTGFVGSHLAEYALAQGPEVFGSVRWRSKKVARDLLGYQYFKSYGLRVIRTRSFNTTGPRRGEVFASSNFAKQIVEIEQGLRPPVLAAGNLEARRDFSDVRDIVRGYWLAVEKGAPGEVYNLASGRAHAIEQRNVRRPHPVTAWNHLDVLGEASPGEEDLDDVTGHSSKLGDETGWAPRIPFEQTLEDLLDYWRQRLGAGAT